MKRLAVLAAIPGVALLAAALVLCRPRGYMISRDIGCGQAHSPRAKQICTTLSESMEWTWMGHAIVSPGWRVTWRGLARVYCRVGMTDADVPVLESMKGSSDWRLQSAVDDLIRLVESRNGKGTEPDNSIFNPGNENYILRAGCQPAK